MIKNNSIKKYRFYISHNGKVMLLLALLYSVLFSPITYAQTEFNDGLTQEIVESPDITSESEQYQNEATEIIITKKAFALLGEPKYADDFAHFDYVNPDAPKGGLLRLAEIGNFDNFNRYASRGAAERNSALIYERLFTQSADEVSSYYPLLATSVTYSDRYQWAEVTLNEKAKFQDGVPVTAEDVAFTFDKFMTQGVSQYRVYNADVSVVALDTYRVRITLAKPDREKLLSFVGSMMVIPKHFWQDRDLSEPLTEPPIGSGPYYINDYKLGQYAVYQRDINYWGQDLPVNVGLHNFDQQRIEYYMDENIRLEAFKAGEYDFNVEGQPKNWFTQYQGDMFDLGHIIKQTDPIQTANDTRWLAFNLNNPLFQDIRVRQALTLAFNFDWINHAFYYNSYKQPSSFFENTPYAATGLPTDEELIWLQPFADIIQPTVFGDAYHLPNGDPTGFNRENLRQAQQLLADAGWIVQDQRLIHQTTKQPFVFELLTYMGADVKYALPFQQSLKRLGIEMNIVSVDYAQITRRLRERDYDMMQTRYLGLEQPSSDLIILWGSQYLNSSWNASGLHNQAIDSLIEQISAHIDDEMALLSLGRALDRVLTHEYPMIPMWYPKDRYYAYWNKFGRPQISPRYSIGLHSWWWDQDKAANLPNHRE